MSNQLLTRANANPIVLGQIRLVEDRNEFFIVPNFPDATAGESLEPFTLPLVPKSQMDWLAIVCEAFAGRHGRCLASLLFLDPVNRRWSTGFPKQRCSADSSCWQTSRQDFPHLVPSILVAGSFQRRILSAGEEPADAVPPVDGLHLILCQQSNESAIWTFICSDRKIQHVRAERVIRDDLEQTLDTVLDRAELI